MTTSAVLYLRTTPPLAPHSDNHADRHSALPAAASAQFFNDQKAVREFTTEGKFRVGAIA